MRKERGFTLIELLAVIVILAIIALIATPLILNVISDAKKGAFRASSYGIIEASEQAYSLSLLKANEPGYTIYEYEDGEEILKEGTIKINYKGSKPNSGTIIINPEGQVAIALYQEGYCALKSFEESVVRIETIGIDECKIDGYEEKPDELEEIEEDESGANDPILNNGMIPIVRNTINTKWLKADIENPWYNYDNQEWANAVLVTEESRSDYINNEPGTPINEEDVLAYLVWIPRYKYKLFNATFGSIQPQKIEIEFQLKGDTKETGTTNGQWRTHPAFTFGTEEVNGIWVGKFETSTNKDSICYTDPSEANCVHTNLQPVVKPNYAAVSNQNVNNQFLTAQKFNNQTFYGLTSGDAHMMKNTEWGAVAYLSHSKYGKYGNDLYSTENKAVYQNKSTDFITGNSNGTTTQSALNVQCKYDNVTDRGEGIGACGAGASTTGTIYGVYDMNGGLDDRVMGNHNNVISESGFSSMPNTKYYDRYSAGAWDDFTRSILGDAIGETRRWYNNDDTFIDSDVPWLDRGGSATQSSTSGVFNLNCSLGDAIGWVGFRIVYIDS